jgi:hypothetical protein
MYYDRISRRVHLEIGEKEHLLAFTLSGLEQLEARAGESLVAVVTGNKIPKISLLVDGFQIALQGGGERMEREEAKALAEQAIDEMENGIADFTLLFMALIGLSGFLGNEFSHKMCDKAGLVDKDGDPVSIPKNVKQAKRKVTK